MNGRLIGVVLLALLLCGEAAAAQGRPLRARGRQDLTFGQLLGGLPSTVLPTDPLNAGQIEVSSERLTEVLISFLLPPALIGPAGAAIPLAFGPGSAGYSIQRLIDNQIAFDPAVPILVTLPRTAQPSAGFMRYQRPMEPSPSFLMNR